MMGSWKLLSGVMNMASYPVLCIDYLKLVFPILSSATGATPLDQQQWVDGYFAKLAVIIAGKWLKYWIVISAVISTIGLYEAQLSSCASQVLGMADTGTLPRIFQIRSQRFNTPWVGILLSTSIALGASYMEFKDIIASVNFLYSLGMLLEFSSCIWLRKKMPKVEEICTREVPKENRSNYYNKFNVFGSISVTYLLSYEPSGSLKPLPPAISSIHDQTS